MASFFDLTPSPIFSNPYIAGLVGPTVFKPGVTISYVLQGKAGSNGMYNDGGQLWAPNGARGAFTAAVAAWNAVSNLKIEAWPFYYNGSGGTGADWIEQIGHLGADDPELGRHDLPSSQTQVGVFNSQHPYWSTENNAVGGYSFITFLHEIGHGIGFEHPHDGDRFPGVSGVDDIGDYGLNQGLFTVMSYNDGYLSAGHSPSFAYGWQATPGALDIAALQAIYGPNMATKAGDNVYLLPGVNAPGTFFSCIWDAGGTDTLSAEGSSIACTIDLRAATLESAAGGGGWLSRAQGIHGGFTIANGAVIENAIGGGGDDMLTGNAAANRLEGGAGNDWIDGGDGADLLFGGDGDDRLVLDQDGDRIDGGAGNDILELRGYNYTIAREGDGFRVSSVDGSDFVTGVEQVRLGSIVMSFDAFRIEYVDGLRYIASYTDLIRAFGFDDQAGRRHFIDHGEAEGRTISFDAARYAAGYADLIRVFGGYHINIWGLTEHYIHYGAAEGRSPTMFDPLSYAAANPGLISSVGLDPSALSAHYVRDGFDDGLTTKFDALGYLASYTDLIAAFGADEARATEHFVRYGLVEGRSAGGFDGLAYIASYSDLIAAFGTDEARATRHYIGDGHAEGRSDDGFDALRYIASYADLIAAFGADERTATEHYIRWGFAEGRTDDLFDPAAYLLSYPDLGAAGLDAGAALRHWISSGHFEGRVADLRFGGEQASHEIAVGAAIEGMLDAPGDRDWFGIALEGGTSVSIRIDGAGSGAGGLADAFLRVHDDRGRLIAFDDNGGDGGDATLSFTPQSGGLYYLVAGSAGDAGAGSYLIAVEPIIG